jgi:competence protein ComEC
VREFLFAATFGFLVLALAVWRGAGYDAGHRCPEVAPEFLRGVAAEVRVGPYGDRVLARGEGGSWGFVASVATGAVEVGERFSVSGGKVGPIEDFLGDGGQIFPYANLMRSRGYCFAAKRGAVEALGESRAPPDRLRAWGATLRARIGRVLPPVAAALSAGALLGGNDGVGDELEEDARRAGLAHALALSGFNVAVFAGAVDLALRQTAPRAARILGGALAGWLLVALAGLPPSGVRAALAWSIGASARLLYREAEAPRALLYAALLYAWWNPLALAFDVSLQLSVLACLGLAAWASPVAEKLVGVPGIPTVREAVAATVAASAATLPISAWAFGQVSVVAPIANGILAYAIPAMMWAGLAAATVAGAPVLAGALGPPLALPAETFAAVAAWAGGFSWSAAATSLSAPAALFGSLAVALLALASVARARRRALALDAPNLARLRRAVFEAVWATLGK